MTELSTQDLNQSSAQWLASTLLADRGACVLDSRIKPLRRDVRLHGRALTVSVPQGDNLAIHAALALARAGDVLVIDGAAYTERALMGGIMCTQALKAGIAGIVIDGAIRDVTELRMMDLPVFAIAAVPAGPAKNGSGSILRPIECGGVSINPGDWIFGDDDGVVAYRHSDRESLLDAAKEKYAAEQKRLAAIASGVLTPPWLQEALSKSPIDVAARSDF
ncbi:RraA family protein [Pollutimonas harenae]|uniref:Putative 4-hydroxy-4-methyl-2-oxoglutarate aldolase n=1 Tax=Pollutimonas harenae TaxID=657015 RepID=A0A853GW72_9BURK|nr:RraA family protein [Pollutimonas harenae]NYT86387.1 RraA family protein [Pollutimonas harenae]TEA69857.1 RraA family protein [Pollutimonas harenae]